MGNGDDSNEDHSVAVGNKAGNRGVKPLLHSDVAAALCRDPRDTHWITAHRSSLISAQSADLGALVHDASLCTVSLSVFTPASGMFISCATASMPKGSDRNNSLPSP